MHYIKIKNNEKFLHKIINNKINLYSFKHSLFIFIYSIFQQLYYYFNVYL